MSSAQATHDADNQTGAASEAPIQLGSLDSNQIMSLLRHLPGVFTKLAGGEGSVKDSDAAQTLSNLSQAGFATSHQLPQLGGPNQANPFPPNDPGPSSHPRGPPNLGQLSALASQSSPISATRMPADDGDDGGSDGEDGHDGNDPQKSPQPSTNKRSGRSATMGSEEWTRQRKDNHKEVERRRRGNINEGINELGRIVPNGSGEKAKGAILSRAVQYIHHLKENEARNIEKWTLEKLLMDQAMGDLQAQLEEMRRLWEEERQRRQTFENELEVLRGGSGAVEKTSNVRSRSPDGRSEDETMEDGRGSKRQKVD